MQLVSDLLSTSVCSDQGFDTFLFVRTAIVDDDHQSVTALREAKTALKVLSPRIPCVGRHSRTGHTGMGRLVARTPSVHRRKSAHHEFHVSDTGEHGRLVPFLYACPPLVL